MAAAAVLRSFSMKKKDVKEAAGSFSLKWKGGKTGSMSPAGDADQAAGSPREEKDWIPQTSTADAAPDASARSPGPKSSGSGLLGMRSNSIKARSGWQGTRIITNLASSDNPVSAIVSPFPGTQGTSSASLSNPSLSFSRSSASAESDVAANEQEVAVLRREKEGAEAALKAAEAKWKAQVAAAEAKAEALRKAKEQLEAQLASAIGTAVPLSGGQIVQEVSREATDGVKAELGSLKMQLDIKTGDCEGLEKQVNVLQQDKEGLAQQVKELKDKLMDNFRTAEEKVSTLRGEKHALEARLEESRRSVEGGSAADVSALVAEKAALEEKLKHAAATAEAAAVACLQMQNEKQEHLTVEETLRKELGAAKLQVSQLTRTHSQMEEQVALLRKERDDLQYHLRWGKPREAADSGRMDSSASDDSAASQLEQLKAEKAAVEASLRKELDAAALQLNHLLTDKAVLEEKLSREMKMHEDMFRLQTKVGPAIGLTA